MAPAGAARRRVHANRAKKKSAAGPSPDQAPLFPTINSMAQERTARLSASPPLFRSRFLDFFSRIHPAVPALIYVPVIVGLVWLGIDRGAGGVESALLVLAGLVLWTLAEYWLHRKVFHWEPDHPIGSRMHFIIHGVHHDHPNDKMRLVMPPGASIPLALLFFAVFWLILGSPTAYPIFAGFLVGYLMYDYMHYYLHHFVPKSDVGKRLREQHMRHHFQDHRYGYGVSSPIWDVVFGTLPRKRNH
jgi:sterol desaturase/sphingolipid hydroxylase (fatty acid hydroxylase superfamily)